MSAEEALPVSALTGMYTCGLKQELAEEDDKRVLAGLGSYTQVFSNLHSVIYMVLGTAVLFSVGSCSLVCIGPLCKPKIEHAEFEA